MRISVIILVLIGFTIISSCEKETIIIKPITVVEPIVVDTTVEVDTIWMYYDETGCSDPWGVGSISEQEKKVNIENYLNGLNIDVFLIEISEDGVADNCFACYCKTGFIIKCKIKEEDVTTLLNDGFYH